MAFQPIKRQRGFTLLELIVVIIVISILGLFAIDRIWALRIAAEQAAVSQIVGSIRSALGLEVARLALAGDISAVAKLDKTNPVPLLAQAPNNYLGEKDNDHGMTETGAWYYDKQLQMLVYNVIYSENLVSPLSGVPRIRYQLKLVFNDQNKNNRFDIHHDSIGGLDLFPVESFKWNSTAKINYE
ncbi:MAG: prepilin-type N-terminal cleavage/methylation domain-containing protein [Gammaproteobacteria bacterium]|nr:prepilin-type N-terminal cleavage/methylation domain-containing protein [Gammaproteobacteria bacterium]